MRVQIGDRWVGEGEPCFVIAEAGANHNRDLAMGKALIDVAADAGADAVKFQTYSAETLYSKRGLLARSFHKRAPSCDHHSRRQAGARTPLTSHECWPQTRSYLRRPTGRAITCATRSAP